MSIPDLTLPCGPSRSFLLAASLIASIACSPAAAPDPTPTPNKPDVAPAPAVKPAPADPVAATPPTTPVAPATPPGPLRAQDPGAYRPCELAIETCTKQGKPCVDPSPCAINLVHVIPEGISLYLPLTKPETLRWRYAADERVLASPEHDYRHTGATTGIRARKDGRDETTVTFDKRGRLRQIGDNYRLEYTSDGRAAGSSDRGRGGKWKRTVTYAWAADHTYKVSWTYPDADEFCEPEPSTVDLDAHGRVTRQTYADCQIDYSEFTLNYHYDATNRLDALDVACSPGSPNATTWHLALKYECP